MTLGCLFLVALGSASVWVALSFAIGCMCNRIIIRLVAFGGLAAFSHFVSAADLTGQVTLAQALALTLKQNPELAAFSWDLRSAEARILQARLRPNPEFGVQSEDVAGNKQSTGFSHSQTTLQLSQLLELGGKRSARLQEATFGREIAKLDYESKRLDILKKTAQAFVEVLSAQERVRLAQENLDLASGLIPDIRKRIEAGKASAIEQTRSEVAVASARIELDQVKRSLITARQHLAAQWSRAQPKFERVVGDLEHVTYLPSLENLSLSLTQNPEIARWEPETDKRQATLRLQQAQAVPNVILSAGPRYISETGEWTQVIGFSLPLPLWNRNQGAILEARHQLAKADDEKRGAVTRLSSELSDAYQTVARTSNEIHVLKESVLPGAEKAADAIRQGYEAGRFSYLDVNEARRTLTAARLQYLQALSDYHKAVAEIEALTVQPFDARSGFSK
ncbi:MAG: TolC family protein [Verrucomicrobia bacterium]|nr:MAG: TolC family protein [Verrucomicrobiota bacterium]